MSPSPPGFTSPITLETSVKLQPPLLITDAVTTPFPSIDPLMRLTLGATSDPKVESLNDPRLLINVAPASNIFICYEIMKKSSTMLELPIKKFP